MEAKEVIKANNIYSEATDKTLKAVEGTETATRALTLGMRLALARRASSESCAITGGIVC